MGTYKNIFLHMGPGSNAQVESLLLRDLYPNTLFWDQPAQHTSEDAFKNLVLAAQKEITTLAARNNGPIKVIGHSFGGHILHQLTLLCPEHIASCTLFSTGYDIVEGFYNLLKIIGQSSETTQDLKNRIQEHLVINPTPTVQNFWSCISLVAQDPAFFRFYWPQPAQFEKYVKLASSTPPMDMLTFQNVINDFLTNFYSPKIPTKSSWTNPVQIIFGNKDPLLNLEHEVSIWKKIFPQAQIKVQENSGHFTHLESIL